MLKYFSSVTTLAMVSSIAKPNAKKLKQQQKLEYLKLIFDSTDLFSLIFLELKKITEIFQAVVFKVLWAFLVFFWIIWGSCIISLIYIAL